MFCPPPTSPNYNKTYEYLDLALKHTSHARLKPSLQDRAKDAIGSEEKDFQDWRINS